MNLMTLQRDDLMERVEVGVCSAVLYPPGKEQCHILSLPFAAAAAVCCHTRLVESSVTLL